MVNPSRADLSLQQWMADLVVVQVDLWLFHRHQLRCEMTAEGLLKRQLHLERGHWHEMDCERRLWPLLLLKRKVQLFDCAALMIQRLCQ